MYTMMELHDDFVTTCLKLTPRSAIAFALIALGGSAGCTGEAQSSTYGPPPECDAGPDLCGTTTGMGAGSTGGQGGSGGPVVMRDHRPPSPRSTEPVTA